MGHHKDLAFTRSELGAKGGFCTEEGHYLICALQGLSDLPRIHCRGTREGNGEIKEPCGETVAIILVRNQSDLPRMVVVLSLVLLCNKPPQNSVT